MLNEPQPLYHHNTQCYTHSHSHNYCSPTHHMTQCYTHSHSAQPLTYYSPAYHTTQCYSTATQPNPPHDSVLYTQPLTYCSLTHHIIHTATHILQPSPAYHNTGAATHIILQPSLPHHSVLYTQPLTYYSPAYHTTQCYSTATQPNPPHDSVLYTQPLTYCTTPLSVIHTATHILHQTTQCYTQSYSHIAAQFCDPIPDHFPGSLFLCRAELVGTFEVFSTADVTCL